MKQDPAVTAKESFDFWQARNAPAWVIWSLLGDEQRETSFDWTAVGDKASGGAHGICQWHDARANAIEAATGIDVRDPNTSHAEQLSAAFYEMSEGEYRKVWPALLATQDVYGACYILVHDYERAAKTERDVGIQIGFAQSLAKAHADWMTEGAIA